MAYIHEPKLKYPDKESGHMFIAEKVHDYTYDANFNYRLKGFKYGFIKFWLKVLMIILVKPLAAIRYALIIKGKKNIKEMLLACLTASIFFIPFNFYFSHMGNWLIYDIGFSASSMGLIEGISLLLAVVVTLPVSILINKNKILR